MKTKNSDQTLKELQEKLIKLEKEKSEYLAGWQREKASFLNYKHQENKRLKDIEFNLTQSILKKILPVLDDFSRLASASQQKNINLETLQTAINQIQKKLELSLAQIGISKIDTKEAEFDPHFHEAVEQVSSRQPSNKIVEEISPGYLLNGKLLRAAKVKVSK